MQTLCAAVAASAVAEVKGILRWEAKRCRRRSNKTSAELCGARIQGRSCDQWALAPASGDARIKDIGHTNSTEATSWYHGRPDHPHFELPRQKRRTTAVYNGRAPYRMMAWLAHRPQEFYAVSRTPGDANDPFTRVIPMPLIRATDARSWKECTRRAWYDRNPPSGWSPPEPQEFDTLTAEAGIEHEKIVLHRLEAMHTVVPARSQTHATELMREGVPVIYQAPLECNDLVGRPGFLIRRASGDYQPADAKLKRAIDPSDADDQPIMIQIGVYRRLMGNGLPGRIFLANGDEAEIGPEADVFTEQFIASMRGLLDSSSPPPASGATKCGKCPYRDVCLPEFTARGELTLLAEIAAPCRGIA